MLCLTSGGSIKPSSRFALNGSVEPDAGLVNADRSNAPFRTEWLVGFSGRLLFDFDSAGRLGSIEVVAPINRWPLARVAIPEAQEMVTLLLSNPPREPATLSFHDRVILRRDTETGAVEASLEGPTRFDRCLAVGRNVFVATLKGAFVAVYMNLGKGIT